MKENTQIQNNKYSDLTFEELKTMAEQGCVDAQYNLAKYYKAKNDWAKAAVLFAKAAEQGDKYAQFYLGVCYELGKGVEQNFVKAADWYTKAAEQGMPEAQFNIARLVQCIRALRHPSYKPRAKCPASHYTLYQFQVHNACALRQ